MRLSKAKISQLNFEVLSNENIGEFKIPVDDPMVPDDLECTFELYEYLPDLVFREDAVEVFLYIDV